MSTDGKQYQIWVMRDQGSEKIPIPVLPETYELKYGNRVQSYDIVGLGEAIMYSDPGAAVISFSSYFPNPGDPMIEWYVSGAYAEMSPDAYETTFRQFLDGKKLLQLVILGTSVNMFCRCTGYTAREGEEGAGEISYTVQFTEHRETSIQQVSVDPSTNMAQLPPVEAHRPDTRIDPLTVMAEPGDTLTSIVRKLAGSGTDITQIYADNVDVLKNPCLLEPGTILKVPR